MKITIEIVKKYPIFIKDLECTRKRLEKVSGEASISTVQRSAGPPTYKKTIANVRYLGDDKKTRRLKRKISELENKIEAIEEYVDGIEDDELRLILEYRYLEGMTYEEVAAEIGYSERTIRRKLENL